MTEPVMVEVHPSGTPARDLPQDLVSDVAAVLAVHGLMVADAAVRHPAIWSYLIEALGHVVDNVPVTFGGRATDWRDSGSGPGWSPEDRS